MPEKGFTLIELLVVVAIILITLTIGLPNFQTIIASNRLTSATNALVSAFQLARVEALKQHKSVFIVKKTSWSNGWSVFVDSNGNKIQDSDELTLTVFDKLNSMIEPKNNLSVLSTPFYYDTNGRMNKAGAFSFCSAANKDFRSVVIANTGRIRVETTSNSTKTYVSECS